MKTRTSIARWVSVVAHPFVMIAAMVGATTAHRGGWKNVTANVGIVALFSILPVAILMVNQIRRRKWGNVDASQPRERPILYAVGIGGVLALVGFLLATRPHSHLVRGSLVTLVLLLVCAGTTRWIKVSLHVTAAALTATTLILLGSVVGWIVAAILPMLAWSRLALGRHRPVELVLGLALGVVAGVAIHFP